VLVDLAQAYSRKPIGVNALPAVAKHRLVIAARKAKLQQQCALERLEVIVLDEVDQSSGCILLYCDTLEIVEQQRRIEAEQIFTVEHSMRPYAGSSN